MAQVLVTSIKARLYGGGNIYLFGPAGDFTRKKTPGGSIRCTLGVLGSSRIFAWTSPDLGLHLQAMAPPVYESGPGAVPNDSGTWSIPDPPPSLHPHLPEPYPGYYSWESLLGVRDTQLDTYYDSATGLWDVRVRVVLPYWGNRCPIFNGLRPPPDGLPWAVGPYELAHWPNPYDGHPLILSPAAYGLADADPADRQQYWYQNAAYQYTLNGLQMRELNYEWIDYTVTGLELVDVPVLTTIAGPVGPVTLNGQAWDWTQWLNEIGEVGPFPSWSPVIWTSHEPWPTRWADEWRPQIAYYQNAKWNYRWNQMGSWVALPATTYGTPWRTPSRWGNDWVFESPTHAYQEAAVKTSWYGNRWPYPSGPALGGVGQEWLSYTPGEERVYPWIYYPYGGGEALANYTDPTGIAWTAWIENGVLYVNHLDQEPNDQDGPVTVDSSGAYDSPGITGDGRVLRLSARAIATQKPYYWLSTDYGKTWTYKGLSDGR